MIFHFHFLWLWSDCSFTFTFTFFNSDQITISLQTAHSRNSFFYHIQPHAALPLERWRGEGLILWKIPDRRQHQCDQPQLGRSEKKVIRKIFQNKGKKFPGQFTEYITMKTFSVQDQYFKLQCMIPLFHDSPGLLKGLPRCPKPDRKKYFIPNWWMYTTHCHYRLSP